MNSEIFTQIILAIITIIGAVMTYYVIPLLKEKVGEAKYNQLADFVYTTVRAANQIFDANSDKKIYVKNQTLAWLKANKIDLSEEQIEAMIEGLVNEVKKIDGNN